jgi:hypothetical protein
MGNSFDASFMIAVTEATNAAKRKVALIEKVAAAMKVTCNHWMLTDDTLRFKAAVGGAIIACTSSEDRERLVKEMKGLNALSALLTGVPVDFDKVEISENPIGLMGLWGNIKEEEGIK